MQAIALGEPHVNKLGIHALEVCQYQQLLDAGVVAHIAVEFRVNLAPLLRGLPEKRHVQDIGLRGVGDGRLRWRDRGRDEMRLDGVSVDAVVELRKSAVEIPRQREPPAFVVLQALKFFDEIELELNGNPGGELEGNIFVGVCATVTSGPRMRPMAFVFSIHCLAVSTKLLRPV